MHDSAMKEIRKFAEVRAGWMAAASIPKLNIAEIGSLDVNGSARPLFAAHNYTGFDIEAGRSVDAVMQDAETIPAESNHYDVVLSANCLEHVRRPWVLVLEMARIVKPGGLVFLLMPAYHTYHAHPIDCWRAYAEGMRGLLENAQLEVLECYDTDDHDTVGVGRRRS